MRPKIITTSWDDGNPFDLVLADLLGKYNLGATFYVPRSNAEHAVMTEETLITLSHRFEIGGHTLHHVPLIHKPSSVLEEEIRGCYTWLLQLLGKNPVSFCFPLGSYDSIVIKVVERAGFKIARTTELLNVTAPSGENLLHTTLQVYQHSATTYFGHLLKRNRIGNLVKWLKGAAPADLLKMTDFYLDQIEKNGGCFHLWGHSWEIEAYNLWSKLELIFKQLSNRQGFSYVSNGALAMRQPASNKSH